MDKREVPGVLNRLYGPDQEWVVVGLLSYPGQSAELMRKREEFGILERCVRL